MFLIVDCDSWQALGQQANSPGEKKFQPLEPFAAPDRCVLVVGTMPHGLAELVRYPIGSVDLGQINLDSIEGLMANKDRNLRKEKRVASSADPDRAQTDEAEHTDCGAKEKVRQGQLETLTAIPPGDSSSEVRDAVGRRVRASYGELIQQPIPDKFLQLLDELQVAEEAAKRRKP